MRICIVTVYDSINSGSFWQAKSLETVLEQMGHSVCFLRRVGDKSGSSSSLIYQLKKTIALFVKEKPSVAWIYIKRILACRKVIRDFPTIDIANINGSIDCFVLGSDTIWNLNSNYFLTHRSEYWGEPFLSKKIITYAASIANTDVDTICEYPELIECVKKWSAIGVRDYNTSQMIELVTNKEVKQVCDPTLLLTGEMYPVQNEPSINGDYIFLYLFDELGFEQLKDLCEFANNNNLKIVQGAGDRKYKGVDYLTVNSPLDFVTNIKYAKYVITDSFHGTVFSTLFEKNFVSINKGKEKIEDYLKKIGLSFRLLSSDELVSSALIIEINYKQIRQRINELRNEGVLFLKDSLETSYE